MPRGGCRQHACLHYCYQFLVTSDESPLMSLFLIQIGAGGLFSMLAVKVVEGAYPRDRQIFGWHPLNPAPSAASIAAATAAATGIPAAASALLPKQKTPPQG